METVEHANRTAARQAATHEAAAKAIITAARLADAAPILVALADAPDGLTKSACADLVADLPGTRGGAALRELMDEDTGLATVTDEAGPVVSDGQCCRKCCGSGTRQMADYCQGGEHQPQLAHRSDDRDCRSHPRFSRSEARFIVGWECRCREACAACGKLLRGTIPREDCPSYPATRDQKATAIAEAIRWQERRDARQAGKPPAGGKKETRRGTGRLYHRGLPGLTRILPASALSGADAEALDYVCLTAELRQVKYFAACRAVEAGRAAGAVYACEPVGNVVPNLDAPWTWRAPEARVVGIAGLVPVGEAAALTRWVRRWAPRAFEDSDAAIGMTQWRAGARAMAKLAEADG